MGLETVGDIGGRFKLVQYRGGDAAEWDHLVAEAPMATFLHSRRFLSHQGDRFSDQSLLLHNERSNLVGVFPAAVDPTDPSRIVSHPGITYGGVVHRGDLVGAEMVEAVDTIRAHYAHRGFSVLRYKAVPGIYHELPSADDVYAVVKLGGRLYRCDLSCAIDLAHPRQRSERRRRGESKARRLGVEVVAGHCHVEELWGVLEENLKDRHNAKPTHSVQEIRCLLRLCPRNIEVVAARLDGVIIGGAILFISPRVVHTQYIASNAAGRQASALDAVLQYCIDQARSSGSRFFDFGTSTEDEGHVLNADLHKFKSEFGGGGVVHEFYELSLY